MDSSERRGIGSAFATACLAFLAWAFPDMSRLITIPGAIACAALTVYFFWPDIKGASKKARASWSANGRLRSGASIAMLCLILAGGYGLLWGGYGLLSRMTPTGHEVPTPKERPAEAPVTTATTTPAPAIPLRSIMGDLIYACLVPAPAGSGLGTTLFAQQLDYFSKNLKVFGDSIGAKFDVSAIDGGIRIDMDALTDGPRAPITGPFHKGAIEIRRVGNFEVVNIKIEMPELFKLFSVNPDTPEVVTWANNINHLLAAKDGTCHLI